MTKYTNKKILIFGLARSGYEVAKLLVPWHNQLLITDKDDSEQSKIKELAALGVSFIKSDTPETLLDDSFDYVIKNPGISLTHPLVLKAAALKIKVINEVEVAYDFLKGKVTLVGITGSNGKTTTTTITYGILKQANLPVLLAGNIGYPLSSIVNLAKPGDIVVMEVSDHQLVNVDDFKTDISLLTNLSEVHLDFHGSYDKYKQAKKKIFKHHTKADLAILNLDNDDVMALTSDIKSTKEYFSSTTKTDIYLKKEAIYYQNKELIKLNDILLKGNHNYENIMGAILIAKHFKVSDQVIKQYLKTFKGVEHRLEYVTAIKKRYFYNDSKATNPVSTIVALKSFDKAVILLLGGLDRGHSFEPLNPYLKKVKAICAFGETRNRINDWAKSINLPCYSFEHLKEATLEAYHLAKPDTIILLSPACASWDQYKDMEERGNEFKEIVNNLKKEA